MSEPAAAPGTTVNVGADSAATGPLWHRVLEKHGILTLLVLAFLFMQERTNQALLDTNSIEGNAQLQSVIIQERQTELLRGQSKLLELLAAGQKTIITTQSNIEHNAEEQTRMMRASRGLPESDEGSNP